MSEEKKQRLREYQKNYCKAKTSQYNVFAVIQLYTIKTLIIMSFTQTD